MSIRQAPDCNRHEVATPTVLRSLHSDSLHPEQLVGLYECPQCGHEQRVPIDLLVLAEAGRPVS